MDKDKNKYEAKVSELVFARQSLEHHQRVNKIAQEEFSEAFKEFVKIIPEGVERDRLIRIAGIDDFAPTPSEDKMSKAALNAKSQAKNKKEKAKQKNLKEQEDCTIPPSEEPKPKEAVPQEYKKLYRKIALMTHPDRLAVLPPDEREDKTSVLLEANKAIEDKEYWKLVECAMFLGIDIPDDIKYNVTMLQGKIKQYKNKVEEIKKSVAWEWFHMDDEKLKLTLVDRYSRFLLTNFDVR